MQWRRNVSDRLKNKFMVYQKPPNDNNWSYKTKFVIVGQVYINSAHWCSRMPKMKKLIEKTHIYAFMWSKAARNFFSNVFYETKFTNFGNGRTVRTGTLQSKKHTHTTFCDKKALSKFWIETELYLARQQKRRLLKISIKFHTQYETWKWFCRYEFE